MTRLLVLWLLSEQALHGYRIKRILEDEAYAFWFAVEFANKKLIKRIKRARVEFISEQSDRTIYSL